MTGSSLSHRRVVITGLGVICPLGNSPQGLWERLCRGESGVGTLSWLSPCVLPTSHGAEVRDFTGAIDDFGPLEPDHKKAVRKGLKVMCRESQMGVAAAQRAIHHARITQGAFDHERAGVVFGSDYMLTLPEEFNSSIDACLDVERRFQFARWATDGMAKMNPFWLLKYLPNMPASHIAIYNDFRGPNNSITQREAAGNLAIGEAFRVIARDHAEIMVAGATGTRVHPMKAIHAVLSEEVAGNGLTASAASRPFDLRRGGMVLGEGAGAVVLEELQSAQARGATIHGEIVACGSSSVMGRDRVARRDLAMINALRGAMREANLAPREVGHLHAHGLSTRTCDADEAKAIREVFGDETDRLPVVAAKSHFGNLGAGSGLVEFSASTVALENGGLFPVLNYETPDPQCRLAVVTTGGASPGDCFVNLNVTPQGQASCVVVRKW